MPAVERISLFVPCRDGARTLARTLRAAAAQTRPPDETLVVDDGSADASAEVARSFGAQVVRHPRNLGVAAARNTGLRESRFDWVASLDADAEPAADWLERLSEALADPGVAMAGGGVVEAGIRTFADRWRRAHLPLSWGPRPLRNPRYLAGNNTLARRSALLEAGGYDPALRRAGEDLQICLRLRAIGYDLAYDPRARVRHTRTDTIASLLDTCWRYAYYSRIAKQGSADATPLAAVCRGYFRKQAGHLLGGSAHVEDPPMLLLDLAVPLYLSAREILQRRAPW